MRFDIVNRNAAARSATRHVVDVYAQFSRHPSDRGRRRRGRLIYRRGGLGRRTGAAADVDDLPAPLFLDARLVRRDRQVRALGERLIDRAF
jgi:hypothetical protein